MPTIAQSERAALADLLDELGPSASTLCVGWDARDLAAHLVTRERRLDALPGVAVSFLAGHTDRVQSRYALKPYDELVQLVRSGPGRMSWASLPKVDRVANMTEYFVHHEDLRRAQPGWAARKLPDRVQDGLWRAVKARASLAFRGASSGVVLRLPSGEETTAAKGEPTAVVTGEPAELLLYVFGRRGHAMVEVSGPAEARDELEKLSTSV